jgi:hypothetical protein
MPAAGFGAWAAPAGRPGRADEPDAHRPLSRAGSEQHMGPEAYLSPGAVPLRRRHSGTKQGPLDVLLW